MILQQNEVTILLLGTGVLIFVLIHRRRLDRLPEHRMLIASFGFQLAAWFLTVLEGICWGSALNIAEHICYLATSLLLFIWCWRVFRRDRAL